MSPVLIGDEASLAVSELATVVRQTFEDLRLDRSEQVVEGVGLMRATWTWRWGPLIVRVRWTSMASAGSRRRPNAQVAR